MKDILSSLISKISVQLARFLLYRGVILCSYPDAFGHQAWNIEYHSRKYNSIFKKFPRVIAFQKSPNIPNKALLDHHRRHHVWVLSSRNILSRLFFFSRTKWAHARGLRSYRPGQTQLRISRNETPEEEEINTLIFCRHSVDVLHVDTKVELNAEIAFPLTNPEKKQATQFLFSENLETYKYFCFLDHSTTYKIKQAKHIGSKYISSESYEQARTTTLESFSPVADLMHQKGLSAVRLGASSDKKADDPRINDYASRRVDSNDFSDLALMNYCKFFVGPNSGIWAFARAFNRPTCLINVFPWPWINIPMSEHSVVVPKKLWHTYEKRFLTIKEMAEMETRFHWKTFYDPVIYQELSIEVVENTPQEITGAVVEINDRIDGIWDGCSFPVTDFLTKGNLGYNSKAYLSSFSLRKTKIFSNGRLANRLTHKFFGRLPVTDC